jgi:hypothetical protein
MFWAKRDFKYTNYRPYQDALAELQAIYAHRHSQFIMVSIDKISPGLSTYYVGVPERFLLATFDGFEAVTESELPQFIDSLLLADITSKEFSKRFEFERK